MAKNPKTPQELLQEAQQIKSEMNNVIFLTMVTKDNYEDISKQIRSGYRKYMKIMLEEVGMNLDLVKRGFFPQDPLHISILAEEYDEILAKKLEKEQATVPPLRGKFPKDYKDKDKAGESPQIREEIQELENYYLGLVDDATNAMEEVVESVRQRGKTFKDRRNEMLKRRKFVLDKN